MKENTDGAAFHFLIITSMSNFDTYIWSFYLAGKAAAHLYSVKILCVYVVEDRCVTALRVCLRFCAYVSACVRPQASWGSEGWSVCVLGAPLGSWMELPPATQTHMHPHVRPQDGYFTSSSLGLLLVHNLFLVSV